MIEPFSEEQLSFIIRLVNADKDTLVELLSKYFGGISSAACKKSDLIKLILRRTTEKFNPSLDSGKRALALRKDLIERELARSIWFEERT